MRQDGTIKRVSGETEKSDAQLVALTRAGDKGAFVEIVARHQTMVCGIAFGILNDFAASEDVAQETFFAAYRKLADIREPNHLRAWLAQITRNTALVKVRRRGLEEPLANDFEMADETPKPDDAAASEEQNILVRKALEKLPEQYRPHLVLFYCEGQSTRAVAEALGLSDDAVRQRLSRGREMLRSHLEGVVETVLKRKRPTALFTMTVAAGIGALAAPPTLAAFASAENAMRWLSNTPATDPRRSAYLKTALEYLAYEHNVAERVSALPLLDRRVALDLAKSLDLPAERRERLLSALQP